jgi:tetratricopeptide (TPR) repeat protein
MDAENAYLFRHAVLRDAAYSLQVPSERAALHELALLLIEAVLGGRPADPDDQALASDPPPHVTDAFASELAHHARNASAKFAPVRAIYLRRAAVHAGAQYDSLEAERMWRALAEIGPRAAALRRAGAVAYQAGRVEAAKRLASEALELARSDGDRTQEAYALGLLGNVLSETGNLPEGKQLVERALAIHREVGNRAAAASALTDVGSMFFTTGRPQTAIGLYQEALEILRTLPEPRAPLTCLLNLGIAWAEIHEYGKAEATCLEALELARREGDRRSEGVALGNLGLIWMDGGKREKVEAAFVEALKLHREVGHRRFEGVNECDFALCLWLFRRNAEAERHFTLGMEILSEINDQVEQKHQIRRMHHVCKQTGATPLVF